VTPAGRDATPQGRAESVRDHGASPQAQDLVNRFTQSGSPISGPAESQPTGPAASIDGAANRAHQGRNDRPGRDGGNGGRAGH
jgi:hypothetical protein